MNEVTVELGCDWHTVKDAVIAHGTALVDHHPNRIGQCSALGLDEPLLYGVGERRPEHWSTFLTALTDLSPELLTEIPQV